MPTQDDVLFARLAIRNKFLDEARARKCLSLLDENGNGKPLGRFLLEKGMISEEQYRAIASHIQKTKDGSPPAAGAAAAGVATAPAAAASATATARPQRPAGIRRPEAPEPSGTIQRTTDIARRDYSSFAGKPIDEYLKEARRIGASDLHFQVDSPPFVRLHGEIVYLKHPVLTNAETEPRVFDILDKEGRAVLERTNDYDFCYEADHGRYRASTFRQRKGIDAVFRVIPETVPTLEDLHLPDALRKFTKYRQGIVLVTGPAGSGKTSTMAALINMINAEQRDHIVTVEDPIEYVIPSKGCNVNQRQVHRHTESYATALRSAMRSDPDYICVGEMRDLETVSMAITAAETGHLVFATLHTTNAIRSVDRIIDIFPPKEQEQIRAMVSESLRGSSPRSSSRAPTGSGANRRSRSFSSRRQSAT